MNTIVSIVCIKNIELDNSNFFYEIIMNHDVSILDSLIQIKTLLKIQILFCLVVFSNSKLPTVFSTVKQKQSVAPSGVDSGTIHSAVFQNDSSDQITRRQT